MAKEAHDRAPRLPLSESVIVKAEAGKKRVSHETIDALATLLDVSYEYLAVSEAVVSHVGSPAEFPPKTHTVKSLDPAIRSLCWDIPWR